MDKRKIFKKTIAFLLCLSFLITPIVKETMPIQADVPQASKNYFNKCYNSITNIFSLKPRPKVIALAYLVGRDDMAAASWLSSTVTRHALYAVDPDTEIQGHKYDSKYYPQDNLEYLKDLKENYTNNFLASNLIYNLPQGAQYIEREGCMFMVVACDEEWVTIWDPGYQQWNAYNTHGALGEGCQHLVDVYMETHPAGFYKIQRNKVWIDFGLKENHPYKSKDEIPKAGQGTVTKLVYLRPVPNEEEKKYSPVYALPRGTQVNVVSTKLVPSKASGSTRKYYKVSFNGSAKVQHNTVQYLTYKVPGVYYVDSRYLNFTKRGAKEPKGAVPGEIINDKKNSSVYAYKSKDTSSEHIGILSKGVELDMFPSESDADWTTVYFSGQKVYVQTKYIKRAPYKVTAISNLRIADIVNDEMKMEWNAGKNNVDYTCKIMTKKGKVLWSKKHYKKNSLIIKRKYIEKGETLYIKVQATDKNGKKGKVLSKGVFVPGKGRIIDKKRIVIGRTEIKGKFRSTCIATSLQYSTNKKFKNAVTVEKKYSKKDGKSGYKSINSIKKLKPNTTYYFRCRIKKKYVTKAGTKWLSGKWTKYVKIKTKA